MGSVKAELREAPFLLKENMKSEIRNPETGDLPVRKEPAPLKWEQEDDSLSWQQRRLALPL